MIPAGENRSIGGKHYTVSVVMNEGVWGIGGMIPAGENRSTGRKRYTASVVRSE
jgi:hypothetical protein